MISHDFLENKKQELLRSSRQSILAIESSTQLASVALSLNQKLVFYEECFRQRSHSEWINAAIDRALIHLNSNFSEIDVISVTTGPGSFTGIRVSTNIAKTLAYSLNLPIISMNTLEVLASQADPKFKYVLTSINAFKNKIYVNLYSKSEFSNDYQALLEPRAIEIEQLADYLKKSLGENFEFEIQVLGDGVEVYPNYFKPESDFKFCFENSKNNFPKASSLVQIVSSQLEHRPWLHWSQLLPTYIRASSAEENR